jgi:hypothetical protein
MSDDDDVVVQASRSQPIKRKSIWRRIWEFFFGE